MIIISPYARGMRDGKPHPKNYPWWKELVAILPKDLEIIQVGIDGEEQLVPNFIKSPDLEGLSELVQRCSTWVSVDSFFQHFAWDMGKYGIVLFAQSDPNIFGHKENTNLLKDRRYLREKQFWLWEQAAFNADAFVTPDVVFNAIMNKINSK